MDAHSLTIRPTFTFKPQQPLLISPHPSFSSISFRTPTFPRNSLSFKIKASSNPNSQTPKFPQNPNSLFSLLKTPLCIAVAATALFFSGAVHRPLPAVAAPVVESEQEVEEDSIPDEQREKSLEEQVASNPDDVEALKSLMELKIKKKKLPEATEILTRLIELEPEEYEWPLLRAHLYSYIGETELAKAGFNEMLTKDPLRVEAFHGLVMSVSQGDESEGGKELDEVMKRIHGAMERCKKENKTEDVRDFKLLIAQIRVIQGRYDEALKFYQELVKEEPRDFRPYLCQGIIYTLLRKKDEAEKQFDKYKRLVPKGHPYAQYFDDNMLATKVFSQMAENERVKMGTKG